MTKILIVDDDPHIREVLHFALSRESYEVIEAENGRQAIELFHKHQPKCLILDIMMPEMEGTEVCKQLRQQSDIPILFLSAKDDEIDRILGLELGGDDYLTKPFSPRELVARVKAVLRRFQGQLDTNNNKSIVENGDLKLDQDQFKVWWKGEEIVFTVTEFGILRTLMGQIGKVYSRQELMDKAYDYHTVVSDRTIDSHIRRIRGKLNKIGGDPLETVHGVGYKLNP